MHHEQLRQKIINEFDSYSKGFKSIARIIIDRPHQAAIKNITELGNEAGVSPATLLRFINRIGFSGYSDFQQIFKDNLVNRFHDYQQTLTEIPSKKNDPYGLLYEINNLTNKGMSATLSAVNQEMLQNIAIQMNKAKTLRLCAFRRMYPVCAYLHYTLTHMGRSVALIDGIAGTHEEQARQITKDDLLLTISYANYSKETQRVAEIARDKQATIVAVTDSELSPFYHLADMTIIINDIRVRNIRMPTVTINILQALCLSLAFIDQEQNK